MNKNFNTIGLGAFGLLIVSLCFHAAPIYAEDVVSDTSTTTATTTEEIATTTIDIATSTTATTTEEVATTTATTTEEVATTTATTTPAINPIHMFLDLESTTSTLFKGSLDVSPCPETQGSTTTTFNAFCALEQSGVPVTWSWWGDDAFLDTISGVGNDYGLGLYWLWFTDLEAGATSFNKHTLHDGENLVVTIGRMPMKITAATTTPTVDATTTISVSEFGFDSSWNSVWLPSASSTVFVGAQSFTTDASGEISFIATSTNPVTVTALKDGFLVPDSLVLNPITATSTTTTATTTTIGGGGGSGIHTQFNVAQAYAYLTSAEHSDGSFGSDMVTDWVAIAIGDSAAPQGLRDNVRVYMSGHTPSLTSATDYERHTMALLALGIDPQNANGVNYIQKITSKFDGTQVGDTSLVNDDIFALFPLAHTGYTANDDVVRKAIQFIISKQSGDGEWESIDMTSAAVQALSLFSEEPGVSGALVKARAFLKASQQNDAGWWNTFSTTWAMQAVSALGEQASAWTVGGNAPQDTLQSMQQSDGGMSAPSDSEMTKIWGTAYAIPAVTGKTWHMLMGSFPKDTSSSGSAQADAIIQATSTATTTATSTQEVLAEKLTATTTPEVIKNTATTTSATVVKKGTVAKKPVIKKATTTPEIKSLNQEAKTPENPMSSAVSAFFSGLGHSIKKLLSFVF